MLPARECELDGVGQWRLIEPQEEDKPEQPPAGSSEPGNRSTLLLITAVVALVVAAAGVAIWATLPSGGATIEQQTGVANAAFVPQFGTSSETDQSLAPGSPAVAGAALIVVVDVQGAINEPGVHQLSGGSRVADAIDAAGGYAPTVDLAAASRLLNLAEKLVDGAQIHVPALGEVVAAPVATGGGPDAGGGGGLIELNTATAEQLDTLPGIGPVTAAKIIEARAGTPFASVDDLLARDVVGASTFEKIRELVTVAP